VRHRDSWSGWHQWGPGEVYAITIELIADRQCILPRAPPAARHIERQFLAFRRQPEFGERRVSGSSLGLPATVSRRGGSRLCVLLPTYPGLTDVAKATFPDLAGSFPDEPI
jgi:hypothetical protein